MESIRWELTTPKARDLTLEAARDAGPRKSTRSLPTAQIKKLLDSRTERDVLDGLRRVVAVRLSLAERGRHDICVGAQQVDKQSRCNMPILLNPL